MAIGYWLGGKFSKSNLGVLAFSSSLYFLFSAWLFVPLGSFLTRFHLPRLTTVLIVLVLFFIPVMLSGMLTPLIVDRLKKLGAGKASGFVYAVGTFGSIVGGLLSGLFLIPFVGLKGSIILAAVCLFVVSLFFLKSVSRNIFLSSIILFILLFSVSLVFAGDCSVSSDYICLFEAESAYGLYTVVEHNDFRFLLEGGGAQSFSLGIDGLTHRYYDSVASLNLSNESLLILGNNIGAVMSIAKNNFPQITIVGVELDPLVTKIGVDWFDLVFDDKTFVVHDDARLFLEKSDKIFDVIFVDLFKGVFVPDHVLSYEFFSLVFDHLSSEGVVLLNIPFYLDEDSLFLEKYLSTLDAFFVDCSLDGHMLKCSRRNSALVISNNMFIDDKPVGGILAAKAFHK